MPHDPPPPPGAVPTAPAAQSATMGAGDWIDRLYITPQEVAQLAGAKMEHEVYRSKSTPWVSWALSIVPAGISLLAALPGFAFDSPFFQEISIMFGAAAVLITGGGYLLRFRRRAQLKKHLKLRAELEKFNATVDNLRTHLQVQKVLGKPQGIPRKAVESVGKLRESMIAALKLDRLLRENPHYKVPEQHRTFIPHESLNLLSDTAEDSKDWDDIFLATQGMEEWLRKDFGLPDFRSETSLDLPGMDQPKDSLNRGMNGRIGTEEDTNTKNRE
jgi:hypothetical protein